VFAGQCSVGWSNDAIDADRDRQVARWSKPIVKGWVTRRQIATAAVIAFVSCVPLSLASGMRAALVHFVAGISAISYNIGVKATIFSPLPYAISFGLLPAFVTWGSTTPSWPRPLVMIATATIGVGAHMVNAVADLDDDTANGVRGLPQRLGSRRSLEAGTIFLFIASCLATLLARHQLLAFLLAGVVTLVNVGVMVAAVRGRPRLAWRRAILGGIGCVVIFVTGGGALVTPG